MISRQYIQDNETTYQQQIKELRDSVNFFVNKSQRLEKENQKLKEQLKTSEKARKEAMEILEESYDFIDENYNKYFIDVYELRNKLSLDTDKGNK